MLKKFLVSIVISCLSWPVFADTCSPFPYLPTQQSDRVELLQMVKDELIVRTDRSDRQLEMIIQGVQSCSNPACLNWIENVLGAVRVQYKTAKISQAIAESRYNFFAYSRGPRDIAEMAMRMQSTEYSYPRPEQIANFDFNRLNFSEEDKATALEAWKRIFLIYASDASTPDLRTALINTKEYFKRVAQGLIQTNILLAFIQDESEITVDGLVSALRQVREFNNGFNQTIQGFRVDHSPSFWANVAILMRDHEMGLVNFTNVVDEVIGGLPTIDDKIISCSAFSDLQRQQSRRVLTSIGVGFGTAVLCGVGIWSGVGTLPALALCTPAIIDGTVGASRGVLNSILARNALYAGRDFAGDILDTEGIVSYADSQVGQKRNQFIAAVNFLGLIPVGKALYAVRARELAEAAQRAAQLAEGGEIVARTTTRGTIIDLVKLPTVDVSVSASETQAYGVAIAVMLLRGVELAEIDLDALLAIASQRSRWNQ